MTRVTNFDQNGYLSVKRFDHRFVPKDINLKCGWKGGFVESKSVSSDQRGLVIFDK